MITTMDIFLFRFTSIILFGHMISCQNVERYPLTGDDWFLANSNKSIQVPASVPGSVYSDLRRAGIIGDPYYRFNDHAYHWIARENWTYTKNRHLDNEISFDNINILFEGVDTIADFFLNNYLVGKMDNQFRRFAFPVKSFLKKGNNTLELRFTSPVLYAADLANGYPYPVPPTCPNKAQHGECHVNFIRKSPTSFSIDWAPAFPTTGIWKSVILECYNAASIRYITYETYPGDENTWILNGTVHFAVSKLQSGNLVTEMDAMLHEPYHWITIGPKNDSFNFLLHINVSMVDRWWPNGCGAQPMYGLSINWTAHNYNTTGLQETDLQYVNVAFRTVELVQKPIPTAQGSSFYFNINGRPIFMKGANWIPADMFQERITKDYLRHLLRSAKEANMNMLRVWGGGVYESEDFYALADELGILIWQEMMFQGNLYPTNAKFLSNVKHEITHQVRRLKVRPSIVLWSGNNECEIALASNWFGIKQNKMERYHDDYRTLYRDTIQAVLKQEDSSRPFVDSSPSNGLESINENWIAENPQDELYGDVHHYDYTSNGWDYNIYPIPRFASEFGYQSWCSLATLANVTKAEDLVLNSSFVAWRQHHPNGNEELLNEIKQHFNFTLPKNEHGDFKRFIYLSQVNQAMSVNTEAEHYRRMQSGLFGNDSSELGSRGYTMGALFWQLNDVWQAPSWSSIEYGGSWKMLNYYARKFFSRVLLSPILSANNTLDIYLINDSLPAFDKTKMGAYKHKTGFTQRKDQQFNIAIEDQANKTSNDARDKNTLVMLVYQWSSLKPLKQWVIPLRYKPTVASGVIYTTNLADRLKLAGCPSNRHCFLHFALQNSNISNTLLPSNFTEVAGLRQPNLKISNVSMTTNQTAEFTLSADAIAPFVLLECPRYPGTFSDNGFIMLQSKKRLTLTLRDPLPQGRGKVNAEDILVTSLIDYMG